MDKELSAIKKRVARLLNKTEKSGYELSDIDIAAIKNISNSKCMGEVNFMALQHFDRLYLRVK
jgi:hypothetical protein